ncbi:MORN repeat-containing protein [Polaribacter butkevichii]|uniref:Uncharacterized protein n=1 Tax=Polaribacter butkevichii TaxID=218490 RepID=A0A2P6C9P0_9FLAO|nr:hypothetical protein [Polaribacter butkevichii]PQJ69640.1 hypothetical protein BTO14_16745 [Polaribacter butkevichii]
MKNLLLLLILIYSTTNGIVAQTEVQKKKAEDYYQKQPQLKRYTNTWYWLFGSSNSNDNLSKNKMVSWELEDGGWYAGLGKNENYTGYGIQFKSKNNSYIFSNWKNTKPNGMTLSQSLDYSFMGTYQDAVKNGFGITKWSNYKPFSNNNYKNVIKYVGEYKNGIWSGFGILYFRDGTYKSGIFVDSILSKELPKLEVLEALGF